MAIDVVIPQIGESVTTVFIAKWLVKPGDAVSAGQTILQIDSDKASMDVPAPAAGSVTELLFPEGDEVAVGAVVAKLGEGEATKPAAEAPAKADAAAAPAKEETAEAPAKGATTPATEVKAGPAARATASEKGVDLATVEGTGPHGRVTSDDVTRAATPASKPAAESKPTAESKPAAEPRPIAGSVTRVKMSPMRRTIARRLLEAKQTTAMLTTFNEVDMSAVFNLRKQYQDAFVKRHGVKLGFMSFFVKAVVDALKAFPAVNAEIDGNEIVYKHFYHIGVAVSGPKGLVVPVLRDADQLGFAEVEKGITALGTKARDNTLRPDDFDGGTFTISNGGIFGSMLSTPILNPPQVGILGMHNIVERPVVVNGQIVIRPIMFVALSYDHRIIDGREAVGFLVRIKEAIEAPERLLIEV